jgi:hypothetical protein
MATVLISAAHDYPVSSLGLEWSKAIPRSRRGGIRMINFLAGQRCCKFFSVPYFNVSKSLRYENGRHVVYMVML